MKRAGIAVLLLASATLPASAVETWQGDLFVTAATNACDGQGGPGINTNDFFRAAFRPRGVDGNGPDTRLALFAPRNAHHIAIVGKRLTGAGNYTAHAITGAGGGGEYAGTYGQGSTKPPAPTPNTPAVAVKVKLNRFADKPGCSVTLQGVLGNRPGL